MNEASKTKGLVYTKSQSMWKSKRADQRRLINFDRTVGGHDPCGVLSLVGQSVRMLEVFVPHAYLMVFKSFLNSMLNFLVQYA